MLSEELMNKKAYSSYYIKIKCRNFISGFFFTCLLSISNLSFVSAQKSPTAEYQVKAVFLYNFTQFVEWPPTAFASKESPLIIGVLGDNPFGTFLEETVSGEKVNGHPLAVQYYKTPEDIKTCHLLFINISEKNKQEEIALTLKGKNILTVTNNSDLVKQEEAIRFFIKSNKIQFQINPEVAKESNLLMSSKLLNIAKIFGPK